MAPEEELFRAALTVRERAYARYSGFPVGCALRTASGKVHVGCNVENQSYPEGWCAETSAIAAMVSSARTPDDMVIVEVMVVADLTPPITPCGGCRQRLREFGRPETLIHSGGLDGPQASWTLAELLPAAFGFK